MNFQRIEQNFNKNFLLMLHQLSEVASDDAQAHKALENAYQQWYHLLQETPSSTEACEAFYGVVKDHHEWILGKDEKLFTVGDRGDLLCCIFKVDNVSTPAVVNLMDEASKSFFWEALVGLYRLSKCPWSKK
jgi:hypothetical protein